MQHTTDTTDTPVRMGMPPENRRQALVKLMWVGVWMVYLASPIADLAHGGHGAVATVIGCLGLLAFVGGYLALVFRTASAAPDAPAGERLALLGIGVLAAVLTVTLGPPWLVLFVYVGVACGTVLPLRSSRIAVPGATAVLVALGLAQHQGASDVLSALAIPALLGGFAMVGVRELVRTTVALREARATVAHLAATEERLRLARDLHDLLGHSMSLVTLKSELAGRLLPDRPVEAGQQVADIERVSRQALVDVREAVSGFRRPTLEAEVAGARTALAAAGITADLSRVRSHHPDLPPDEEGALAWALREAVTNVVRHSGARHCAVTVAEDGPDLCLTVADDGRGATGPHGNGLAGLSERLQLASGRLETEPGSGRGFVLRAYVPLSRHTDAEAGVSPLTPEPA